MTTDAQRAANRRNARHSTGPRTAQGKAAASRNARRHGATGASAPAEVATWVRVIRGDPDTQLPALMIADRQTALALALAEAEARLGAATAALEAHLNDPVASGRSLGLEGLFEGTAEILMLDGQDQNSRGKNFQDLIEEMKRRIRHAGQVRSGAAKRQKLLRRYAREAQGHRKRAFANWIAYLAEQRAPAASSPEPKPATPNQQPSRREGDFPKRSRIQL